ncbi:MAG: hypothetical protein Tsb0032_16060 [Kiloniellaceae bacterium]
MTSEFNPDSTQDSFEAMQAAEVSSTESGAPVGDASEVGAGESGGAGSDPLVGQAAPAILISRPAPGQIVEIQSVAGRTYALDFPAGDAQVEVDGDNFILGFDDDGDGTPDSQLVFLDMVPLSRTDDAPVFQIAGADVGSEVLLGQALVLAGVVDLPDVIEPEAGPIGGGVSVYNDDLGTPIDLLGAEDVIPPVELQFGLIDIPPEIILLTEDNSPPEADPVLTPAEQGDLPPDLIAALEALGLAEQQSTPIAALEAFLGVPAGTFSGVDGTQGSAIKLTFEAESEDFASFDWNFLTNEGTPSGFNDSAYVVVLQDGAVISVDLLADTSSGFFSSLSEFNEETGYMTLGGEVPADGTYTIGVVVFDVGDTAVSSGLLVDNFQLNGTTEGFESGTFAGWITSGNVEIVDGGFQVLPTQGNFQALLETGFEGAEGGGLPEVVLFKKLTVDGVIGDDDTGEVADFGGADAETPLENLVFTLETAPTYGQLILVTGGGATSFLNPGDTYSSADTVWWFATESDIEAITSPDGPEGGQQALPDVEFVYSVTDADGASAVATVVITVPDSPPQADEVITLADRGDPPQELLDALDEVDGDPAPVPLVVAGLETAADAIDTIEGGEGGNELPEILLFKQLLVDGDIGDDDTEVADFGGADAETPLEDLIFTLETAPAFGQLILVTSGGVTTSLEPGDTYSSADKVWWVTTQGEVDEFMQSEGLDFLPEAQFFYSVTDEDGGTAEESVTINLPPLGEPSTALESDCIFEDTEGAIGFSANPNDGLAKITQIVISGFPTGDPADAWVVDDTSVSIPGYTLGTDYTASYDAGTGELTIQFTLSSFALGESIAGSVNVTPNPDSDVDVSLSIEATASNGSQTLTADASTTVVVDAVADPVTVDITVNDSDDPELAFAANETGTVNVVATFGDADDGSETHTVTVDIPEGFTVGDLSGLPEGVSAEVNGDGDVVYTVGAGVTELDHTFDVTAPDSVDDEESFLFQATAQATETTTGDEECTEQNNLAQASDEQEVPGFEDAQPFLIVGENVDDIDGETTPHRVHEPTSGQDYGEIVGDDENDVLIGDVGGGTLTGKTMNLALVLDTSGSMEALIDFNGDEITRIEALDRALEALLDNLAETAGLTVRLHLVSFATDVKTVGTFDIVTNGIADADAVQAAKDFVLAEGDNPVLEAAGDTNYEAGFQAALDWFEGDGFPPEQQILASPDFNKTIFISDGLPNVYYIGDQTAVTNFTNDPQVALQHVLGTFDAVNPANDDNFSEFGALLGTFNGVNATVDAIGINVDADGVAVLSQVDEAEADNITEGEELAETLDELAAITDLADVGGDLIIGNGGDDLIFGDAIFTDLLADEESIDLPPGSGWAVIEQLADDGFFGAAPTTQAIIDFLRDPDNQADYDFARESTSDEDGREGGADTIDGGAGADLIFGQEGDDVITGGADEDTLSGGSGADSFIWDGDSGGGETDIVTDFDGAEGDVLDLSALLTGEDSAAGGAALADYLNVAFDGTDTTITVDADGDGGGTDLTIVCLGVDLTGGSGDQATILQSLLDSGSLVTD